MRCICLSVDRGWIFEVRFEVEIFEVQVESEGRSPTKDVGRSPASEMLGGGSILESCFSFLCSAREGILCLEFRVRPWGMIWGSAVMFEEFQPITGESTPKSFILGDDSVVCTVNSVLPRCTLGVVRLRLPVP